MNGIAETQRAGENEKKIALHNFYFLIHHIYPYSFSLLLVCYISGVSSLRKTIQKCRNLCVTLTLKIKVGLIRPHMLRFLWLRLWWDDDDDDSEDHILMIMVIMLILHTYFIWIHFEISRKIITTHITRYSTRSRESTYDSETSESIIIRSLSIIKP